MVGPGQRLIVAEGGSSAGLSASGCGSRFNSSNRAGPVANPVGSAVSSSRRPPSRAWSAPNQIGTKPGTTPRTTWIPRAATSGGVRSTASTSGATAASDRVRSVRPSLPWARTGAESGHGSRGASRRNRIPVAAARGSAYSRSWSSRVVTLDGVAASSATRARTAGSRSLLHRIGRTWPASSTADRAAATGSSAALTPIAAAGAWSDHMIASATVATVSQWQQMHHDLDTATCVQRGDRAGLLVRNVGGRHTPPGQPMRPRDRERVPLDHLEQRPQRRAGQVGPRREAVGRGREQRGLGRRQVAQMRCEQRNPHLLAGHQRVVPAPTPARSPAATAGTARRRTDGRRTAPGPADAARAGPIRRTSN